MAREIERKYLIESEQWRAEVYQATPFAQGYLNDIKQAGCRSSVRVRIEGRKANMNIKSLEIGISRDEYEYSIPVEDAKKMLDTLALGPVIKKTRHLVKFDHLIWEIDEFHGDNEGLVVAEVELTDEKISPALPEWVGKEVTELPRYYNVSLSSYPYSNWSNDEKFPT